MPLRFSCFLVVGILFLLSACNDSSSDNDEDFTPLTDGDLETESENPSDGDSDTREGWEIPEALSGLDPDLCKPELPVDIGRFDREYALVTSGDFKKDKNYYLLTVLDENAEFALAMDADEALAAISAQRSAALKQATCGQDLACWSGVLRWSEEDIVKTGKALAAFSKAKELANGHLRPSGYFQRYGTLSDSELIEKAWSVTAEGLNEAWGDFSDDVSGEVLSSTIERVRSFINDSSMAFYQPLLRADLLLMSTVNRDEAARYEPLTTGANQAAISRIPGTDWDAYPFSVILVPGQGPKSLDVALDPAGALRCDLAAERYKAGMAPFILVSGGHVHPDQTPHCEAMEMKSYLMENHAIPEEAILVDPHARHTTTNLRNASRQLLRYGFPPDKAAMTTTDFLQSLYILALSGRCEEELGYQPYRTVQKMTTTDNCFLPSPDSLTLDPRDPLDP